MLDIINPATGAVIEKVATDNASSIAAKFKNAREGQPGWARISIHERCKIIGRFRDALKRDVDVLAAALTEEMGKPITQARGEVLATPGRVDFFIENVVEILAPELVGQASATREIIEREPLGVIANISAWNYPYFVGTNVFIPALLAGNAVLYKPSEHATRTGLHIARLLWEAGVPAEVFQPILGGGDVVDRLLDEAVDGVFFTGSYETGKKIAEKVAPRMIPVQLELGGKDPVYVCDDVDPKTAARSVADGAFYNTGQSCCAVERVYVHSAILEPFVEALVDYVRTFEVGDPMRDDVFIGPLARREQMAVLEYQVADAVQKGADLLTGGKTIGGKGHFFQPTVMTGVDHTMTVMTEETFGPVIGVQEVS
ncbi:MAG: aldehyde dehydrogenase family protein, partial [Bradymonadaceae bacterium]